MWGMHGRTTALQAQINRRRSNVTGVDRASYGYSGQVHRGQGPESIASTRNSDNGRTADARSQHGSDRNQQGRSTT